jgi:hypothetical protein
MKKDKVIELLKTGEFTVAYHDNDSCYIYKGHRRYENLGKEIFSPDGSNGYAPEIVEMLVEALGGNVESI